MLSALIGLLQTSVVIGLNVLYGLAIAYVARTYVLHVSLGKWKEYRIQNLWRVNTFTAPFVFLFFGVVIWALSLSPTQAGFNFNNFGTSILIAVPLALLLSLPGVLAFRFAPDDMKPSLVPMRVPFGRTLPDAIGTTLYALFLVGPIEEILFRGIIQTILMQAMPQAAFIGPWNVMLGTVIAALVFVFYHYRNVIVGGESREQFFRAFPGRTVISLIIALLYQSTGSLVGPIIFHNLVDTCMIATMSFTIYSMRQRGIWPEDKNSSTKDESSQVTADSSS
jgi:membrane protease YdiL (CAAX protease family)